MGQKGPQVSKIKEDFDINNGDKEWVMKK
jgi:hypothetical protein